MCSFSWEKGIPQVKNNWRTLTSKSHDGPSFLSVISVAFFNSEIAGKGLGRSPYSSLQLKTY